MGSNHSVTVRGNEWYDHAAETGGGPVSFLKEFYGMDYQQAVMALLESNGGPLPQIRAPNVKVTALAYYDSVYSDQELSHRAKLVYIFLKDHADKDGTCWPRINTIAAGVSLSRSTVKRALDDLVRAGLVVKEKRWRGNGSLASNLYRIK